MLNDPTERNIETIIRRAGGSVRPRLTMRGDVVSAAESQQVKTGLFRLGLHGWCTVAVLVAISLPTLVILEKARRRMFSRTAESMQREALRYEADTAAGHPFGLAESFRRWRKEQSDNLANPRERVRFGASR